MYDMKRNPRMFSAVAGGMLLPAGFDNDIDFSRERPLK